MATPAQITANRANSQLSTGPKTPDGIANSKLNATRHGLTGKQVVIRGEDASEYDALRASLIESYAPATEHEAMLVEEVAQNWWRLQRARRIEAEVIAKFGEIACMIDPEASKAFQRVTRYLNSIERSWRKSIDQLEKLQAARHEEEVQKLIVAAAHQPLTTPPIGFVSKPSSETSIPSHAPSSMLSLR